METLFKLFINIRIENFDKLIVNTKIIRNKK